VGGPCELPGAAVEEIVSVVKHQIIFGRLKPRERLVEDDLCEQFGVSRHLIRSVFVRLEHLGLITRRPNKGVVVRDLSVEEVEEIYDMRALLQAEATRRIPLPASRALLEQLRAIHAEHARAIAAHNLGLVCSINNEFHRTFFAASGNRLLTQMIERLWTESLAIRCYAIGDSILLARSQREHGLMIEALAAGDRTRMVQYAVDHIWPALEAYKRAHGGWAAADHWPRMAAFPSTCAS
jgi:DNA-binding GntR family transcriptional regulator